MSNKDGVLFYKRGYFFKPNLPFIIFGVMFARHLWHKDFITIAKIFCQRVFPSFLTLFFRIKFTSLEIFNVLLIGIVSFAAVDKYYLLFHISKYNRNGKLRQGDPLAGLTFVLWTSSIKEENMEDKASGHKTNHSTCCFCRTLQLWASRTYQISQRKPIS